MKDALDKLPENVYLTIDADGFLARVLQHEIDHLNGVLYIDKLVGEPKSIPDYPERRVIPTMKKLGKIKKSRDQNDKKVTNPVL